MWNISESTVKRWADAKKLKCFRTPGGHRKFPLEAIFEFQRRRGFEATGIVTTEEWEDPNLEVWLNQKNFGELGALLRYLAVQNQRSRVTDLLQRLYLRGMRLDEIYDDVLVPVDALIGAGFTDGTYSLGQLLLIRHNIEEALCNLFPQIVRRRRNGRTALCAAPMDSCRLTVNGISRILEVEGWECLNLGEKVPFSAMAEMVEEEPINLVCLTGRTPKPDSPQAEEAEQLSAVARRYRIPVVLAASATPSAPHPAGVTDSLADFRRLRRYLRRVEH